MIGEEEEEEGNLIEFQNEVNGCVDSGYFLISFVMVRRLRTAFFFNFCFIPLRTNEKEEKKKKGKKS